MNAETEYRRLRKQYPALRRGLPLHEIGLEQIAHATVLEGMDKVQLLTMIQKRPQMLSNTLTMNALYDLSGQKVCPMTEAERHRAERILG